MQSSFFSFHFETSQALQIFLSLERKINLCVCVCVSLCFSFIESVSLMITESMEWIFSCFVVLVDFSSLSFGFGFGFTSVPFVLRLHKFGLGCHVEFFGKNRRRLIEWSRL